MKEIDLLRLVANDHVGWYGGGGGRGASYRWWANEHDYSLVTRPARKLVKAGLIRRRPGPGSGLLRGPVELTSEGRQRLKELEAACTST